VTPDYGIEMEKFWSKENFPLKRGNLKKLGLGNLFSLDASALAKCKICG